MALRRDCSGIEPCPGLYVVGPPRVPFFLSLLLPLRSSRSAHADAQERRKSKCNGPASPFLLDTDGTLLLWAAPPRLSCCMRQINDPAALVEQLRIAVLALDPRSPADEVRGVRRWAP